jgi:hypothetical protein
MVESARLALRRIATLDLAAASGIALRRGALYVIADDELALAVYSPEGARLGSVALREGALPEDPVQRKAAKPDFEALLALPDESLLVLGSGSTPQRARGTWLRFDPMRVEAVDLSPLYARLAGELPELNIEGGAVSSGHLQLCSRGNGARRENALIRLDLASVLESLAHGRPVPASAFVAIARVALPDLEGVPLSLTDLAAIDDRLLFTAAAEASANTYDDGECAGSVIGELTQQGVVRQLRVVEPRLKLEGLCLGSADTLWLVADADDRAERAPLLQADWKLPDPDPRSVGPVDRTA